MSLNIIKVEEQVNHGDHAQDVTVAIDHIPGETIEHLAARVLTKDAYWPETGNRPNPSARVTIRVTEGHEFENIAERPKIVCVCGSTRFRTQIEKVRAELTLAGNIVLGSEVWVRSDPAYSDLHDTDAKARLDTLHKRKIDLADEVFIANVGGYMGDSTRAEVQYALMHSKSVTYLEEPK